MILIPAHTCQSGEGIFYNRCLYYKLFCTKHLFVAETNTEGLERLGLGYKVWALCKDTNVRYIITMETNQCPVQGCSKKVNVHIQVII